MKLSEHAAGERSTSLSALDRSLRTILSRRVSVVVGLWGEAGQGKTHAARQLLSALPCASLSLPANLSGAQLASALPQPTAPTALTAAALARLSCGEHLPEDALIQTLAALLSASAPFVLHLEDLHEVSPERLSLTEHLARVIKRTRGVGLLVTSRQLPPAPFVSHLLPPMNEAENTELLSRELGLEVGAALPDECCAWLQRRTRGNPLFTLEFVRHLRRQGFLWNGGDGWHWRTPPDTTLPVTVEALISQSITAATFATPSYTAALESYALLCDLLGEPLSLTASPTLWASVSGLTEAQVQAAAEALGRAGFLHHGSFAHPLYREVLCRTLSAQRRQSLARRAMEALGDDPRRAALFVKAADPTSSRARSILERAAQACSEAGQRLEAAQWLAARLEYVSSDQRAELALAAARELAELGSPLALGCAELAAEQLPEAAFLCVRLLIRRSQLDEAQQRLAQDSRHLSAFLRWQLMIELESTRGRYAEVQRLWQGKPDWQADAPLEVQRRVGSAHAFMGELGEARAVAERLLARPDLDSAELMQVRNLLGQVLHMSGAGEDLLMAERETIRLARSVADPLPLAKALMNHALSLSGLSLPEQGQQPSVRQLIEEARQLFSSLGLPVFYAVSLLRLANEALYEGAFEEAERLLGEAHTIVERHHDLAFLTESHLKQARLYLDWQPLHGPPLALRHAQAALELSRQTADHKQLHHALIYAARAAAQNRHAAPALAYAQEALDHAERGRGRENVADAQFALGLALEASGQLEAARMQLSLACQTWEDLDQTSTAQHRRLELDRLADDREAAYQRRDELRAAGSLGAAHLAERYFPPLADRPLPVQAASQVVRLQVLGPLRLERGGQPLVYRSRKRSELLAFLLETRMAGRSEVSILELLDTFYPEQPEAEAKHTLNQQIYLIRGDFGPGSVLSTGRGYALGKEVVSDAEQFLEWQDTTLWRGAYLGESGGWLPSVRDALALALRAQTLALLHRAPAEAARLSAILCQMEPYDQALLRLAVEAHEHTGHAAAARQLYAEGRSRLIDVGETLPPSLGEFLGRASA